MNKIETARLLLRSIEKEDAAAIYEFSRNPNVGLSAGWKPHETLEETLEIMNQIFIGQEHIFGIILKDTNKLIGSIGLMPDPHRENPQAMMMGYALAEEQWGKGLMKEAATAVIEYGFKKHHFSLITCTCYPDNIRSHRVIEKCGFIHEGRLRQCEVRYDGAVMDMECFSITPEEWEKRVYC